MGGPPNPRARQTNRSRQTYHRGFWRRIVDPAFYLKAVIVGAFLGLIVIPSGADVIGGLLRVTAPGDGCRVLQVIDGDTVSLWCPGRGVSRARLIGFDTPELFSPRCASELTRAVRAQWHLRWLVLRASRIASVRVGTDHYGRDLVGLYVDGKSVALEMIASGNARPYDGGARGSWC